MRKVVSIVALAIGCGGHGNTNSPVDAPGSGSADAAPGADAPNPPGGTPIHLTLNNRPNTASTFSFIVAYQDGSGPWQLVGAPTGDTYTFNVNSPSYGVAWTCKGTAAAGSLRTVDEAHFAVAERTTLTFDVPARCTDRAPTTFALTGTVTNRQGNGTYSVEFDDKSATVGAQGYNLKAESGTHDVVLRHLQGGGGGSGSNTTDVAVTETVVDRGVAVNAATTDNLDASNAVATQAFPVTMPLATLAGRQQTTTILYTAGGTTATLIRASTVFATESLNATQMMAGDVYDQQILVGGNGQTAIVTNATAHPAAQTYTAPTPLGGATSTVATTMPYPQVSTTWAPYANTIGYVWTAAQTPTRQQCGGTACTIAWTVQLSPGVTGSSPGYRTPNLSALTGWDPALAFVTGATVTGYAEADTSSAGASDFPNVTPPAVGTQRVMVRSAFTVTP
jgi:hypothetical protein